MGCGASKGSGAGAAVPQQKTAESRTAQAAAPITSTLQQSAAPASAASKAEDTALVKQSSVKGDTRSGTAQPPDERAASAAEDSDKADGRTSLQKPSTPETADGIAEVSTPERPADAEAENPARAAFRSQFQSLRSTDYSPSPQQDERGPSITFKSSRSLNRSIGVRRRTSDNGGGDGELGAAGDGPSSRVDPEEEDVMKSPDSVLEKFEKTKGVNPLLRKATEKSMLGGPSHKTMKTQKRLAVGFALEGGGTGEADSKDADPSPGAGGDQVSQQQQPDGTAAASAKADGGG